MRCGETSGCRHFGRAPARQDFAFLVEDAHARVARYLDRTEALRDVALVPRELGHVGAAHRIESEVRRPLRVRPFAQVLAVRAEDLDAIALTVTHKDAAFGIHRDAMRKIELARASTGLSPRSLQLSGGRKSMHAGVAVAVGNID